MKESQYTKIFTNFLAIKYTLSFAFTYLLFTSAFFVIIEIFQLFVFLIPIKILIIVIANDIRDLITDFSLLGLTTMNMKELITIYALIVAISLVMRLIYFNIQKHGGLKLAKISINKNKKIPGAGKFLPDGTKTLKPESEGEFKIKKLRMCNKRFGITNGFFGNFLLILLFLVGIYFLSVNIFLVLIALVSLNYIIAINLKYLKKYIHSDGIWPTLSFLKAYFRFSEIVIFFIVFMVAAMTILSLDKISIYLTIGAVFAARRTLNAATQLFFVLLATPVSLSNEEQVLLEKFSN